MMGRLVLARRLNESIRIGDDIRITVVRNGTYPKLMIEAPEGVQVWREEIWFERSE